MVNDEILGTVILYVRQYKLYVLQNNTILCKQANKSSDFHLYKATKDKSEVKVGSFFYLGGWRTSRGCRKQSLETGEKIAEKIQTINKC